MKQGTTTTFKVKQFDLPDITEIIFSFTNDKNNVVVERTTPTTDDGQIHKSYPSEVSLEDGYYKIGLDQDETLKLAETFYVEAQIMFSGAVTKAYIDKVKMPHTFYTKVIDGATTNGEEIELTMELSDVIEIEGGGTGNYNDLSNKPKINNIELVGNKTTSDLGLDITTGDGLKKVGNVVSADLDENSILTFNNHKLSADISGLQVSGGNGIDVSNNVVSVDKVDSENNALSFYGGKLMVSKSAIARDSGFRMNLTDTNYINALATRQYVDNLVSGRLKRLVVQTLPSTPDTNTIYMVLKSAPTTNNIYDEYMYINNAWELIGSTEVDLSNYYTKTEVDTALGNKQNALTVGNGIDITSDTISVSLSGASSILNFVEGELWASGSAIANDTSFQTTMPYNANIRQALLTTYGDYNFQPKLRAGTNITIDSNNVISASGGGLSYTFTDGLKETSGTVGIDLKSGTELQITNDQLDIDLSSYATQTDLSSKQDTIDSSHKLSADNVDDTSTTNKFTSASEKATWNAKADISDIPTNVSELTNDSGYQTSSDVATAISGKADNTTISTDTTSTTVSLTLADNHEYRYTQDLSSLTLTMPSGDFIASVVFASGSTPTQMTYDSNIKWSGDDITNGQFVPTADKDYDICLYYNGLNINGIVRGA